MLPCLFDYQGPLLIDLKDLSVFITGKWYYKTLERLRRTIKAKPSENSKNKFFYFMVRMFQYRKCRYVAVTLTTLENAQDLPYRPDNFLVISKLSMP